jgi:putative transposase
MNTYKRHRFLPDIISYAVWLYYRFNFSHRRYAGPFIEDLLAERGITVSPEAIRLWCIKFGALYARRLARKHRGYGDTFFIDEVFVKINGKQHYLWRAVDRDGEVVDVFLQARRDGAAAKRFFKRLLRSHGDESREIVTDKLRSYGVAPRELMPEAIHSTKQYANNRAKQSHEATRVRERGCGDSNRLSRLGDSLVPMLLCPIYSIWDGTCSEVNIIATLGSVRSMSGAGQLLEGGRRVSVVWRS